MPSKVWIPTIGDKIKLTADWTFKVTPEYRNADLSPGERWAYDKLPDNFTIPADTVLKIERIYIRGAYRDYDSVTFRVQQCPRRPEMTSKKFGGTSTGSVRFFAKLTDVNNIEAEPFNVQA